MAISERTGLARRIAEEMYLLNQDTNPKKEKKEKQKFKEEVDFKLGGMQRLGEKRKLKKNYALVILMLTNGNFNIKLRQIRNDQIYIKETDTYHSTTTDCIGYYKKYPVVIIPEWDLQALSKKYLWDKSGEGRYAKPQSVIIHNIEMAIGQMKLKTGMGGKSLIWILLIVGIVGYLAYYLLSGK